MLPSRFFSELTQPEIAAQFKKNPLVILPAGSVEQHGPHLPTGTDTLAAAKANGHGAVILLGDALYYARFGFSTLKTGELSLPGPFERDRLLGIELREGALDGARGMIAPTGSVALETGAARRAKALRRVPHAA